MKIEKCKTSVKSDDIAMHSEIKTTTYVRYRGLYIINNILATFSICYTKITNPIYSAGCAKQFILVRLTVTFQKRKQNG